MTVLKKKEMTIFGTEAQMRAIRASEWFTPRKHQLAQSDSDFDILLRQGTGKSSIFIALSKSVLGHFLKYLNQNLDNEDMVYNFHKYRPPLISFKGIDLHDEKVIVDDLFENIICDKESDLVLLRQEQLMPILSKPREEVANQIIGLQVLRELKKIKILKGDLKFLYVPMEIFSVTAQGVRPDFDDIEIMEYGHYIRLGEYEASASGILYECDKNYRLQRRKERLESEKSFGACLRRYRIQKQIKQTDFKNTSEKTIRRIENGDMPTSTTKSKILNELEITELDLLTF